MCAETDTVARALSFITACRLDANCELESAEAEEEEGNVNSREHFGLKVGLALSFIAMTMHPSGPHEAPLLQRALSHDPYMACDSTCAAMRPLCAQWSCAMW